MAGTTWSNYTVQPSTLAAGASPNLNIKLGFTNSSDTPQHINLTWAPGLAASPASVATCTTGQFEDFIIGCPAGSEIATGNTIADIFNAIPFPLPTELYMMPAPSASDLAGLGLNVDFLGLINIKVLGTVDLSTSGQVEINFDNVPKTALLIIPFETNSVQLTVDGTVAGKEFTVNPSNCSSLSSTATVTSFKVTTPVSAAANSFTPTGCSSLGFTPSITGSVTPDSGDTGVATTLNIAQNETTDYPSNDARVEDFSMTFPNTVTPNLTALGNATGQQVGTITVTTPLLGINPTGALYLEPSTTGGLPTLKAVIASPIPLTYNISLSLGSGNAVTATLDGLVDLPLSNIAISLTGGPNSLLQTDGNTGNSASLTSTFTGWNGATATSSTPFAS